MLEDKLKLETIEYFQSYLLDDLKKNKLTVNNIIRTVKEFLSFLEEKVLELDARSVKKYLAFIQDSLRESSFVTKVSAIRQFVNWLNLRNNPFLEKDFIFNRREVDYFTEQDFEDLISAKNDDAENQNLFPYKEMILRSFYELHLSLVELRTLTLRDFNQANASFKLRGIKISCSKRLAELCRDYVKKQREQIVNQAFYSPSMSDVFFVRQDAVDKDDLEMQNLELSELIRSYDLSLNKIKRSRIINLLQSGKTEDEILDLLGVKISQFYDQFKPKQNYRLLNAYAQFHPRS